MKTSAVLALITLVFVSCHPQTAKDTSKSNPISITGTWQLVTGTVIEKGDTTVTDYTKKVSFIKVRNDTHFAFFQHDLNKGKEAAVFVSGAGRYSLTGNLYTERLEYCSAREWEGIDFNFTLVMKNDTLIQSGVEKVESTGVNRINIEKYIRAKR